MRLPRLALHDSRPDEMFRREHPKGRQDFTQHLYFTTTIAKMATSVDAKLLKSTKFPSEFNQKVDMQKVNVEVMKK
jgi:hypothetical protein